VNTTRRVESSVSKRRTSNLIQQVGVQIATFVSLLETPHVSWAVQLDAEEAGRGCHVLGRKRIGEHDID